MNPELPTQMKFGIYLHQVEHDVLLVEVNATWGGEKRHIPPGVIQIHDANSRDPKLCIAQPFDGHTFGIHLLAIESIIEAYRKWRDEKFVERN